MSYFNNPRTEEELKDQYRKLLSKYDYHNPQNVKIMSDMRKEYEETLMKIKRANGYRTPLEKVTDSAKSYVKSEINEYKAIKAAEKERINRLRNHKYTKEEYVKSYNSVKHYLEQMIEDIIKCNAFTVIITQNINILDNIGFYQWFNTQEYFGSPELRAKYISAREVLEYAILSISEQTKTDNDKNLLKMEESLGKYFKEYYRKCCDKYLDPIEVAQHEMISQKYVKDGIIETKVICFAVSMFLVLGIFALLFSGTTSPLLITTSIMISILLAFPIGNVISKKIIKFKMRTTYSTFGAKEQKARVTQKKQYENGWAAFSVFRFILSLLGFK